MKSTTPEPPNPKFELTPEVHRAITELVVAVERAHADMVNENATGVMEIDYSCGGIAKVRSRVHKSYK